MSKSTVAEYAIVVGGFLGFVALIGAVLAFFPFVLMLAWNYVVPKLFGMPEIGFWESFALTVVVGILTSGFRASSKSEE